MSNKKQIIILFVLLGIVSVLHYETTIVFDSFHDIYRRLYYIPIVLGGLWFRLRGGIGIALLTTLNLYPPCSFSVGWARGCAT